MQLWEAFLKSIGIMERVQMSLLDRSYLGYKLHLKFNPYSWFPILYYSVSQCSCLAASSASILSPEVRPSACTVGKESQRTQSQLPSTA
jgi:hypothetical protein